MLNKISIKKLQVRKWNEMMKKHPNHIVLGIGMMMIGVWLIAYCDMQAKDTSGKILLEKSGNPISFDANGISQVSMVIPNATSGVLVFIVNANMSQNPYYGNPKVEFGNAATPWTPAPEDILK